jgi:hypothetical protein
MSARAAIWAIVAVLIIAAGWQGYRMGNAACQTAHDAERLAMIEAGRKLDAERRRIAQQRAEDARKQEGAAYAEPIAVDRCLGPDRVRRIHAIR